MLTSGGAALTRWAARANEAASHTARGVIIALLASTHDAIAAGDFVTCIRASIGVGLITVVTCLPSIDDAIPATLKT